MGPTGLDSQSFTLPAAVPGAMRGSREYYER